MSEPHLPPLGTRARVPFPAPRRAPLRAPLRVPLRALVLLAWLAVASLSAAAQSSYGSSVRASARTPDTPLIAEALGAVSEEVRTFNDHLTILASPWMEGRLPGTRGMELAKEYMEHYFRAAGLRAPFVAEVENADGTLAVQAYGSYRQPFKLGSSSTVEAASLFLDVAGEHVVFEHGRDRDFTVTGMGTGGEVLAPAVFVGYAINDAPDGFSSFPEDTDLTGKIAVLLRFEPLGEDGWTRWRSPGRRWTNRAGFSMKLQAVEARGAVAAIIINTPGTADPRADVLQPPGGRSENLVGIPVLHMSQAAGRRLVERATGGAVSLEGWRDLANEHPLAVDLGHAIGIRARVERRAKMAENVIGVLPGRGRLADEYVVIGAHLDHLGMGDFGSNDREFAGKKLHPGADDNASGSAGILLIAEKMARAFAEFPEGLDARSVMFIAFSAEESNLNGSRFYATNPIAPIEKHVLMMNFDMIGRIKDRKLSLSGTETGSGLRDFIAPILEASPLTIVESGGASGGSDHQMFYQRQVPVLFAILAEMHADYHTSRDTSDLINRVDAVHAANLFFEIGLAAALRPEAFPFQLPVRSDANAAAAGRPTARVRLGVRLAPGADPATVTIGSVSDGSSAAEAGLRPGDVLVAWNDQAVTDAVSLSAELRKASPGDEVEITVLREGQRVPLARVELREPGASGRQRPASQSASLPARAPEKAPGADPESPAKVRFGIRPDDGDGGAGVLVDSVTANSPAEKAGIQAGDRLLEWGGLAIAGAAGLAERLGAARPGDEVEVKLTRGGKDTKVVVSLMPFDG